MELKSPVKKGFRTPDYRPPLPIISEHSPGITVNEFDWPIFNGHYNGTSVIVDDTAAIAALTKKGFFGKGSLSRGCPNLGKRKFPHNVVYESQWKRRKHWINSLNNLLKSKDASTVVSSQEVESNNQCNSEVRSVLENLTDDIHSKSNSNQNEENCTKNSEKNSLGDKKVESLAISELGHTNEKNLLLTSDSGDQELLASDKSTSQNMKLSLSDLEKAKQNLVKNNCANQFLNNVKLKEGNGENSHNMDIVPLSDQTGIGDNFGSGNKMDYSSCSSKKSTSDHNKVLDINDAETSKINRDHSECIDQNTLDVESRESLETASSDKSKNTETIDLTSETIIDDSSNYVSEIDKSCNSDKSTQNHNEILVVRDIGSSKTNMDHSDHVTRNIEAGDNSISTGTIDLTGETVISVSSESAAKIDESYNSEKSIQNPNEILVSVDVETPTTNKDCSKCVDHVMQNENASMSLEAECSDNSNNMEIVDLTEKLVSSISSECINNMESKNNLGIESSNNFNNTGTVDLTAETIISGSYERDDKMDESYNSDNRPQNPNEILVAADVETPTTNKDCSKCLDHVTQNVEASESLETECNVNSNNMETVDLTEKLVSSISSECINNIESKNNLGIESSDDFKNTGTVDLTAETVLGDNCELDDKMDKSHNSDNRAQIPNEILVAADIETSKTELDHLEYVGQVRENIKPTGNLEMEISEESKITKTFDLNSERTTLNPHEVLVIADMEPNLEQYFKNLRPHIEEEKIKTVIEVLYLSLEEAFFLSFACNCLQVVDLSSNILGNRDMWVLFQNSQADFIEKYVAYHYFRAKGWVVKSGTKFGGDFLLYKKGPLFFHASYIVIVEVIKNNENVKNNMTWEKVNGINRMADSATKDVILCHVFWPTVEKEQFNEPSVLKEFSVCETLLRKWQATQEKTAPVQ